jgi:hypothetical protein
MGEVKTSSLISHHRAVGLHNVLRARAAVTPRRARTGRALALHRLAWAAQRPPPWSNQLGFSPVGHCGHGLH